MSFDAYIIASRSNALSNSTLSRLPHHQLTEEATSKPETMDAEDGDYLDGNRAFLQALMARGTMTFKEGQKVLAAIFTVQEGQAHSRGTHDLADPFCRKRHCSRGSYTGRLQFLHLCSRRQNLPIRLRNPKHPTSTHKRADTCHHKCHERSHHPNSDDSHTRGDVFCEEVNRCNVRDL